MVATMARFIVSRRAFADRDQPDRRAVAEEGVVGVTEFEVEITWDPPWDPEMMSEAAQLELGFY